MDDFPFYVVQIANWLDMTTTVTPDTGTSWADTRVQQANALGLPHAGMAVTIDVGEAADIHPKDKLESLNTEILLNTKKKRKFAPGYI